MANIHSPFFPTRAGGCREALYLISAPRPRCSTSMFLNILIPLCSAIWWCWNITFSSVKWDHWTGSFLRSLQFKRSMSQFHTWPSMRRKHLPLLSQNHNWFLCESSFQLFQIFSKGTLESDEHQESLEMSSTLISHWRGPETQTMRKPSSRSLGKLMEEPEPQFKGHGLLDYYFSAQRYDLERLL